MGVTSEIVTLCNISTSVDHKKNVSQMVKATEFLEGDHSEVFTKPNGTLCAKFQQFKLSNQKRITVCYYNEIRVDLRRFIGHRSTIQGVWLTLKEWNNFVMFFSKIQKAVINFHA